MDSEPSDAPFLALKILVAGGFGVGKTTLIGAVSEIRTLNTENSRPRQAARPTASTASPGSARPPSPWTSGASRSPTTWRSTSSAPPGRTASGSCGTNSPGGALGAVVLADSRRLVDSFPAIDYFEHRRLPFVVAVNCFDGAHDYTA